MSGGQWMVVLIVAIVMIAKVIRKGVDQDGRRMELEADPETGRLREEVRQLKERLAVLERIATDDSQALDRQIEALRDRPERLPRPTRDHADL